VWSSSVIVTGKGHTPAAEMAENMLNAVGEFSINHKPAYLRLVRIAIFHSSMVEDFARAVAKKIEERNARGFFNIFNKVKGTD